MSNQDLKNTSNGNINDKIDYETASLKGDKTEEIIQVLPRNTTLPKAIFNLTKSAVGAGTLFLPWNMHRMGLSSGIFMIIFAGLLCSSTLHFLARMCANTGVGDYFKLGRLAFGGAGEMAAVAALLLFQFGGLIAYANFAGDYLSSSLAFLFRIQEPQWWISKPFLTIILASFCIFPLACLKDMSKLAKTSLVGLACIFYIIVLTVVDFFIDTATYSPAIIAPRFTTQFFSAFGSIIFAFVNHFTLVALVPVMIDPSPKRRSTLIGVSNITALSVYIIAAVFGYLHFGSSINPSKPDILNSRAEMNVAYAVAKAAFSFVMIFSYPLLCDPARAALDQLLTVLITSRSASDSRLSRNWRALAPTRHFTETALLVALPAFIAIVAARMAALFLDVFSSLCGSFLVFIFPSFFFLRLAHPKSYNYRVHWWERGLAYFNVAFGTAVAIIGTYDSIRALVTAI